MIRRLYRRLSIVVLIAVLLSLLPLRTLVPSDLALDSFLLGLLPHTTAHADSLPPPPPPDQLTVTPVPDPHLPSLVLEMDVAPQRIGVGDTFTTTLIITNQAPDPAANLVITLPLPAAAAGNHSDPNFDGATWTWRQATLAAGSSTTVSAVLTLTAEPAGDALLAFPQVTADGLSIPVQAVGGTLVNPPNAPASTTATYTQNTAAVLTSGDQRTEVDVPGNVYTDPLSLQFSQQPTANDTVPLAALTSHLPGFGTFYLNATDTQTGTPVHQFAAPLTIKVSYTPEQLRALGIGEQDLTLFWFDTSQPNGGQWVPLASTVDPLLHTATTQVDHFSGFQLADGSSPSANFIPSLQGWQVGLYTGNVSYQYPLDVPAGPGGSKPSLQLSYNSTATDGPAGVRSGGQHQSNWAGKGWSLDTGYIALNRLPADTGTGRYYTLVLNGQSFDLVRGACLAGGSCQLHDPTSWEWHATDESFLKVRVVLNGPSPDHLIKGQTQNHYKWQVWTKEGTRYDFYEDAWQGFQDGTCGPSGNRLVEAYKWYLSRVVDTQRNLITYTYGRPAPQSAWVCNNDTGGPLDPAVWPAAITCGGAIGTGDQPRYKVVFTSTTRPFDTAPPPQRTNGSLGPAPRETQQQQRHQALYGRPPAI